MFGRGVCSLDLAAGVQVLIYDQNLSYLLEASMTFLCSFLCSYANKLHFYRKNEADLSWLLIFMQRFRFAAIVVFPSS